MISLQLSFFPSQLKQHLNQLLLGKCYSVLWEIHSDFKGTCLQTFKSLEMKSTGHEEMTKELMKGARKATWLQSNPSLLHEMKRCVNSRVSFSLGTWRWSCLVASPLCVWWWSWAKSCPRLPTSSWLTAACVPSVWEVGIRDEHTHSHTTPEQIRIYTQHKKSI